MRTTISLAELLSHGAVTVQPHEAVAIAQALIAQQGRTAEPPFGPLSPNTVRLSPDGTVACVGCDVAPAVSEVAILLQALLASSARVPGGLRYAIARALLEVDAPPFDSLEEFAGTLTRFERGDRAAAVHGLLERWRAARSETLHRAPGLSVVRPPAAAQAPNVVRVDRRHIPPAVTELRRHLREADQRIFEETTAAPVVVVHKPSRRVPAMATGLAAGVALIIAGQALHMRSGRPAAVPGAPAASVASPARPSQPPLRRPAPSVPALSRADATSTSAAVLPRRTLASGPRRTTTRASAADTEDHTSGGLVASVDAGNRPVFSPAFASNGAAIFFHTGRSGDASSAIGMASTSGDLRVIRILDDGAKNYHAQPSPDGRFIAFDSDRDGERGVYVADQDGSHVRRVSGSGYAAVPTWSPDGTRLTYLRAEPNKPKVWNLWIQPFGADASAATRITDYRYGQPWSASWFRDNRRIAYTHEDALFVLDLQTGHARTFQSPIKGRLLRTAAVSPDGKTIAFQVYRDGGWLLNVADGSMRRVLADPSAEEFAWSPDGRRVAYHSRRDGQWGIYVYSGN